MFAKTIVLSDAFLDMPMGARCLYMTLGMVADDDGFVNSPKSVMRQCGASEDDLRILIAKKFVLPFESGVIVIKHWRINNYLRMDRYKATVFTEEMELLDVDGSGNYHMKDSGIPSVGIPSNGTPRLGKVRLDKDSIGEVRLEDCTEPSKSSAPEIATDAPGLKLNDGTEWRPTVNDLEDWKKLYTGVDVMHELARMRQWCINNPAKRKTPKGIRRFVTTWLDKEQNARGGYYGGRGMQQAQPTGADAYFEAAKEAMNGPN